MAVTAPANLEGRPPAGQLSPLQARIDAAPAGGTVEVSAGEYVGDLIIDRPLRLTGTGRPRLVGSGAGSVVRVRADDVAIEGFEIDGRGGGNMANDDSGIHVFGKRVTIRDCHIVRALFGIYLAVEAWTRAIRDPASMSGTRRDSRCVTIACTTPATASTSRTRRTAP
jgi:nitrous oxidase accessory protein